MVGLALSLGVSSSPAVGVATGPALLARHVPVLVLHPDDPFAPMPVDGFLADMDDFAGAPDVVNLVESGGFVWSGCGVWKIAMVDVGRCCSVRE